MALFVGLGIGALGAAAVLLARVRAAGASPPAPASVETTEATLARRLVRRSNAR